LLVSHLRRVASALVLCVVEVFAFSDLGLAERGRASWYALTTKTASGERCDPYALTAAHRSLPFGTVLAVENLNNGRRVLVRVNDRGPFVRGRIIDVTRGAAIRLGFVKDGVARVRLSVIAGGC
jgi:rare lipoprotein A